MAGKKKLQNGDSLEDYDVIVVMIGCHGNDADEIYYGGKNRFPLKNLYNAPLSGERYVGPPKFLQ